MAHKTTKTFIVAYDDGQGLIVPMVWDTDCEGAICGHTDYKKDRIALFASRRAARTAIDISTKWSALLKVQGKPFISDFTSEYRKYLRIVPCA